MNRFLLAILLFTGCDKMNSQQPNTHDPPIENQSKLEDINKLIQSLTVEKENCLSQIAQLGIKSTKDLAGNAKAQSLISELRQIMTYLEIAQKEQHRQKIDKEHDDFENRQQARAESLKKFAATPSVLSDDKLIASLDKEELVASALKNAEEWQQKLDDEIKKHKAPWTRAQWEQWWQEHTKHHAQHPWDCTVYLCKTNNSFWSKCKDALHQMFPNETMYFGDDVYKVFPKNYVYFGENGWSFIPNAFHGSYCPYHPKPVLNPTH